MEKTEQTEIQEAIDVTAVQEADGGSLIVAGIIGGSMIIGAYAWEKLVKPGYRAIRGFLQRKKLAKAAAEETETGTTMETEE